MKRIFTVLFLVVSVTVFSQKVKLKKDKVIIDDVETYNYTEERSITTISTLSSKEFMSIISTYYEERNPARDMPNGQNFMATIRKAVNTVRFLESGRELVTDLPVKDIIKSFYNSKMIDDNGKIDDEKLNVFINKYNNENLKLKIK